jgi:hypothetical protein
MFEPLKACTPACTLLLFTACSSDASFPSKAEVTQKFMKYSATDAYIQEVATFFDSHTFSPLAVRRPPGELLDSVGSVEGTDMERQASFYDLEAVCSPMYGAGSYFGSTITGILEPMDRCGGAVETYGQSPNYHEETRQELLLTLGGKMDPLPSLADITDGVEWATELSTRTLVEENWGAVLEVAAQGNLEIFNQCMSSAVADTDALYDHLFAAHNVGSGMRLMYTDFLTSGPVDLPQLFGRQVDSLLKSNTSIF